MVRSSRSMLMAATVIASVVLGLLAAPASASTARLIQLEDDSCKYGCTTPPPVPTALVYEGGREANRVTLTSSAQQVRIRDSAARLDAGSGCSRIDSNEVSCTLPQTGVFVTTGRDADRVTSELARGIELIVNGGPGNDVLVGGSGADQLFGGKGRDRLRGRGGSDGLFDASPLNPLRSGDASPFPSDAFPSSVGFAYRVDPLARAGRSRDSFDGGSGRDTVNYEGRSVSIGVDLARRIAGARGERDSLRGVENAVGGPRNDRLVGNRQANALYGVGGRDRIIGRRGADVLDGGKGRNVIIAGPGDDKINPLRPSFENGPDRVSCGPGRDSVSPIFPGEFLEAGCEDLGLPILIEAGLDDRGFRSRLPLRAGRPPTVLSGIVGCFGGFFPGTGCQVRLEIRVRGPGTRRGTAPPRNTLLGSESFTLQEGGQRSVSLGLSSAGLRILRRHRALRVRIRIATQGTPQEAAGYLTVLRAP